MNESADATINKSRINKLATLGHKCVRLPLDDTARRRLNPHGLQLYQSVLIKVYLEKESVRT